MGIWLGYGYQCGVLVCSLRSPQFELHDRSHQVVTKVTQDTALAHHPHRTGAPCHAGFETRAVGGDRELACFFRFLPRPPPQLPIRPRGRFLGAAARLASDLAQACRHPLS